MKKILSLILAFSVFLTIFPTANIGYTSSYDEIPEPVTMKYSDDFSGSKLNARITTHTQNSSGDKAGTVAMENGELKILKDVTNNTEWTGVNIYLNEDKTPVASGEFVTKFKIRRTSIDSTIHVRMRNSGSKDFTGVQWSKNSNSGTWYSTKKGEDNSDLRKFSGLGIKMDVDASDEMVITTYYNLDNQTFSMWINDELVAKDVYPRNAAAQDLTYIRIYTQTKGGELFVDDFEYYLLHEETNDDETDDDEINSDGTDDDIIDSDGTDDEINKEPIPEPVTMIYSDDFGDSKLNGRITTHVQSSDGEKAGTVALENGELKILKDVTDNSEWTGVNIYPDEDRLPVGSGELVIRFKLRRTSANPTIHVRMRNSAGKDYAGIQWTKNNSGTWYSDKKGENNSDLKKFSSLEVKTDIDTAQELVFTTYFNIDNQTFSMWVNDELIVKDVYPRDAAAQDLAYIRIYTQTKGAEFFVDDFQYYLLTEIKKEEPPEAVKMMYSDNFGSSELNPRITTHTQTSDGEKAGTVVLENGELKVMKDVTDNTEWTGVDIYLNEDKSSVTYGEFVTRFRLRRESADSTVQIRMRGDSGKVYTGLYWGSDNNGTSTIWYSDTKGGDGSSARKVMSFGGENEITVDTYYDISNQIMSMWINGKLIAKEKYPRDPDAKEMQNIRIYTQKKEAVFYIDDFEYYITREYTDTDKVQLDYDALIFDEIFSPALSDALTVERDIVLPYMGKYGSNIKWKSSDSGLITETGMVTLADDTYEANPVVTLTAIITSGNDKLEKSFDVMVMKRSEKQSNMPEVVSVIYSNDFSENTLNLNHYTLNMGGGNIYAADGKLNIMRKENEGTTIADIYPLENHKALNKVVGVSYTIQKEGKGAVETRFRQKNSNDFLTISWGSDNSVVCMGAEKNGGTVKNYKCGVYNNRIHVNALFNTLRGTYSLWLNGELVLKNKYARSSPGDKLTYLRFYLQNSNLITTTVDDVVFYNAPVDDADTVELDYNWLTHDKIMTEGFVRDNIIDSDLNLVVEAENGSSIIWESSDPAFISETGMITRPLNTENMPEITLTATIRKGDSERSKQFTFKILPDFSDIGELFDIEMSYLNYDTILTQGETDPSLVKCSLDLPDKGILGADISWTSDNEKAITNSGRVIRPRNDGEPVSATVTATVSYGGTSREKSFDFTVAPDDKWADPDHMSDEEFFGKCENNTWTVEGKLDYNNPALDLVEEAVKNNDYEKAEFELMRHMKLRTTSLGGFLKTRESDYCEMAIADVHSLQHTTYYQGYATLDSNEYKEYVIPVKTSQVSKGGSTTYNIIAKYNEASDAIIASTRHPNIEFRPKIQMTVNGSMVIREAESSITIRAGSFMDTNYSKGEDLTARMLGEFLGDDTYKAVLKFDFSDLIDTDTVSDVSIILHAKIKQDYVSEKEILVLYDPNNFDESCTWSSFLGYVYNYNGLIDQSQWERPVYSETEFYYQSPRFQRWGTLANEYAYTDDEKYPYYMINTMMDFIKDCGGRTLTGGQGWPQNEVIMAGHPRTLDTALRMQVWAGAMSYLVKSDYMNPEVCTAFLKTIWHMADGIMESTTNSGNWMQIEKEALIDVALSLPEFSDSPNWLEDAVSKYETLFTKINNNPDGSYIEKTGGYSQSSLSSYIDFKSKLISGGSDVSQEYNDMLIKSTYYNVQLYGPGGLRLQWGDEQSGRKVSGAYSQIAKWFGDKNLEYIDTFGAKGEKPDWTSMQYPDGRITFMRSDWSKNALYMFTNVRGKGQHGHQDDNGVIVIAYDRALLPDSGIFTYTSTDPDRIYGKSTRAHNTVEINDLTQSTSASPGTLDEWITNDSYDFLSQTSLAYTTVPHKRSIMFLKPDLWIVSDLMTPNVEATSNSYKQLWHMLPTANLTTDEEGGIISSDFKSGANIVIGSADKDATLNEAMGKYDYSYQQVADAKYAYYEKNAAGNVTFDTVLVPTRTGKARLNVERIDLGVETNEATAIMFDTNIEGVKNTYYYLLNYMHDSKTERTFEKFTTNAKLALVRENSKGAIEEIILNGGSIIETSNGDVILESIGSLADISLEKKGSALYITTSEESVEDLEINLSGVKSVYVNGQAVDFLKKADGTIKLTDDEAKVDVPTDSTNSKGGIGERGPSGGGSSGGGGFPSVTPNIPTVPSQDDTLLAFDDISGHWAKDYIASLHQKGIVKGDGNRMFYPDNTITRAEFLAMVMRLNSTPENEYQNSFDDVASWDWFAGVVQTALDMGIISPDKNFRPNDSITREEMCKILCNTACDVLTVPDPSYELTFADSTQISDWALDYVKKSSFNSIINGKDNGCFEPQSNATRAESATVIARLLSNFDDSY